MADDKPITQQCKEWVERVKPVFRPYHDAMDEEDSFLDGDRAERNDDYHNRNKQLAQIRGRETEDTIRHMVATWSQKPRNLQARPIDKVGDPASAEFMTSLVEMEWRNPYKGFERELYKAVMASREHRLGLVWMDWHPDEGLWGEISFSEQDARSFMWDPSYHPHHFLNRCLFRERRLYVEDAREMYDAPHLEPDRMMATHRGRPDQALMNLAHEFSPQSYDDDNVTLWEFWKKKDKSKKYRDKQKGKDLILPVEDRYMSCVSGCGYRSPRQSDVNQELPEMVEQACPTCGGNLERIDSLAEQESIYAFAKGRRLITLAPWSPGEDDEKPLYDGGWPVSRARSYPALFVFCSVRSRRLMGGSDPSQQWDQQIADDQLRTLAIQRVYEHRTKWKLPRHGLYDSDGRRYEMRDDQTNVMLADATVEAQWGPTTVQALNATGLDPSWGMVYDVVHTANTQYSGNTDLGLTEESSKDIAASALAQIQKQKNIVVEDFVKRTRGELAIFASLTADYVSATYPAPRLVRLNLEGTDMVMNVWGQDLPGFDFEIEDTPEFTGLEKARVEALKMLDEMATQSLSMGLPPEVVMEKVSLYAEELHFPPSTVRKFEKVFMKMVEAQEEAAEKARIEAENANRTAEDEAAADLEAGVDVPELPLSIGSPEDELNGSAMAAELEG